MRKADMTTTISAEQALIYVMVSMSGVSGAINDTELHEIGHIVKHLPAFRDFDLTRLTAVAQECALILEDKEGFETVLGLISGALTPKLKETAYALAVEVAA